MTVLQFKKRETRVTLPDTRWVGLGLCVAFVALSGVAIWVAVSGHMSALLFFLFFFIFCRPRNLVRTFRYTYEDFFKPRK